MLTNGYLPSMTMSITDIPYICVISAGTLATILAISAGLISAVLWPSMRISPVHLVWSFDMHFIIVDLPTVV